MDWCDTQGIDYVFGLPGNTVLARAVEDAADDIRTRRALTANPCLRGYAETRYRAKSWKSERRACARIIETASRVRIAFAAACPEAALIHHLAIALMPVGHGPAGINPKPQTDCHQHGISREPHLGE